MNAKMTDPECVTHKVKIAPNDYLKENLLATFTPQKQLTPEQIYWSNGLMKLKSEALKERAKVSRPIKAFTVSKMNFHQALDLIFKLNEILVGCIRDIMRVLVTRLDPDLLSLLRLYGLLIDDEQYVEDFNIDIDSKGLLWKFDDCHPNQALSAEFQTAKTKSGEQHGQAGGDIYLPAREKRKKEKKMYKLTKLKGAAHSLLKTDTNMAAAPKTEKKPHVVFMPYPAQSHIKATLKLAEVLHHKGLQITFINTESNHKHFLESGGQHCLDGSPGFQFRIISDGSSSINDVAHTAHQLCYSTAKTSFLVPFLDLVTKLPTPPTCIISDGFMSAFTIDAAQKLGIPVMLYWVFAACGFMGFYQHYKKNVL
nr:UDP-glycosyltransferase 85C2-like [Tanacetum cinerariifolium]